MTDKFTMTQEGLDDLEKELVARKEKLKEIADRIEEARQQGDLSENAAYTMALSDKEMNEAKIAELEDKINNAEVVNSDSKNNKIELGEKVLLKKVSDGTKIEYEIVGASESDPTDGKISIDSPIGMALANKKKGDKVKVSLPNGVEEYEVEDIL